MEFSLPPIGRESFKFLFPSKFQKEKRDQVERTGKCCLEPALRLVTQQCYLHAEFTRLFLRTLSWRAKVAVGPPLLNCISEFQPNENTAYFCKTFTERLSTKIRIPKAPKSRFTAL